MAKGTLRTGLGTRGPHRAIRTRQKRLASLAPLQNTRQTPRMTKSLARPTLASVMELLPQTQCGRCGFKGCRPYARALLRGQAEINRCPPGGDYTRLGLAALLGREVIPWESGHPGSEPRVRVAIEAQACIGCGRCLPACPVDAIAGAAGYLHTVLAHECTGCLLCLAPCPAENCIQILPYVQEESRPWGDRSLDEARRARLRSHRKLRRNRQITRSESSRASRDRKRREIQDALTRIREERGWQGAVRNRRIPESESR